MNNINALPFKTKKTLKYRRCGLCSWKKQNVPQKNILFCTWIIMVPCSPWVFSPDKHSWGVRNVLPCTVDTVACVMKWREKLKLWIRINSSTSKIDHKSTRGLTPVNHRAPCVENMMGWGVHMHLKQLLGVGGTGKLTDVSFSLCTVKVTTRCHQILPAVFFFFFSWSQTLRLWFENKQVLGTVSKTWCQR